MNYRYILILTFACLLYLSFGCNKEDNRNKSDGSTDSIVKVPDTLSSINDSVISNNIVKADSIAEHKKIAVTDTAANNRKKNTKDTLKTKVDDTKLIAYYFHPTARCMTFRNIEAYSIEAINEWESKTGKTVIWKELNIEDSVNEHYVEEYSLEFSSLVVAKFDGSGKKKWKNLEETWKLVNDKETFIKYVKFELNQFNKE